MFSFYASPQRTRLALGTRFFGARAVPTSSVSPPSGAWGSKQLAGCEARADRRSGNARGSSQGARRGPAAASAPSVAAYFSPGR
ncbi:hypothetical protein NDU88_004847 [Pleurodeles waltl]|uniref:Uncharacterized protein n=1 Tax=Pleurodeles waltl TaxID=8319 RepID=A0AAV7RGV8_PLEWA|nr:hypothetical protein NDU88_004847 [Pleurodeles waltl]